MVWSILKKKKDKIHFIKIRTFSAENIYDEGQIQDLGMLTEHLYVSNGSPGVCLSGEDTQDMTSYLLCGLIQARWSKGWST